MANHWTVKHPVIVKEIGDVTYQYVPFPIDAKQGDTTLLRAIHKTMSYVAYIDHETIKRSFPTSMPDAKEFNEMLTDFLSNRYNHINNIQIFEGSCIVFNLIVSCMNFLIVLKYEPAGKEEDRRAVKMKLSVCEWIMLVLMVAIFMGASLEYYNHGHDINCNDGVIYSKKYLTKLYETNPQSSLWQEKLLYVHGKPVTEKITIERFIRGQWGGVTYICLNKKHLPIVNNLAMHHIARNCDG